MLLQIALILAFKTSFTKEIAFVNFTTPPTIQKVLNGSFKDFSYTKVNQTQIWYG